MKKRKRSEDVIEQEIRVSFSSLVKGSAMDSESRSKALYVRLVSLVCIVILGFLSYKASVYTSAASLVVLIPAVGLFFYSSYVANKAFVEAVWRGRRGKNKELYLNNKAYFDSQFKRYSLEDVE